MKGQPRKTIDNLPGLRTLPRKEKPEFRYPFTAEKLTPSVSTPIETITPVAKPEIAGFPLTKERPRQKVRGSPRIPERPERPIPKRQITPVTEPVTQTEQVDFIDQLTEKWIKPQEIEQPTNILPYLLLIGGLLLLK